MAPQDGARDENVKRRCQLADSGVLRADHAPLPTLTQRKDFLAAAKAARSFQKGVIIQARNRGDSEGPRTGFTCSKKVGNAASRNRAKRRLREAARITLKPLARPGYDYVLIGKAGATASRPFSDLCRDVEKAIEELHA